MKEAHASASATRRGDDRYGTFLALSGDGIARFALDPPLDVAAPEEEQVQHILRHARVGDCNEIFARLYDRQVAGMAGLAMGDLVPAEVPARLLGIRLFIRSRYRLVHGEEEQILPDGSSRWVSGSALGVVEDGGLKGFWLCLREVTERKREEADRARRGRILEAVAFSAARLLRPGSWRAHADDVLARLGEATGAARVWLAEFAKGSPDGARFAFRYLWGTAGVETRLDDPRIRGGLTVKEVGLDRLVAELRRGRPVFDRVAALPPAEREIFHAMGSKAFAAMPVFANDTAWGFLGFGETRYEREWSSPEIEALKAAAALFGAAIERERGDAALQESEERLKRLAAATFEGIGLTEEGVVLDANDQLAALLARATAADLVGRRVESFVPAEDVEIVRGYRQSGYESPYQHRVLRADGGVVPVEVRTRQTPYQGRTVRVTAVRDISAQVEAEERQRRLEADLRQAAEQWRQTFDALDLGIVLADAEGRIVRLNRGALDLAAASFTDGVGRRLEELSTREPWRTVLDLHGEVGRRLASVVAEARDPASERAYYLLGSPWPREEGLPPWRVITFRDVTEFTSMQSQLRQARLVEAMGSLVAGVAHEVRNPLFSISATVDALEAELGRRPEFIEYAALLRSQVNRLTQLMRDLLDYGKPAGLRRTPTAVTEVIHRAARACASLARDHKVAVEEDVAADLPLLHLDAARLEQALQNLLANAIQHAPAGSMVRVRARLDRAGSEPTVRCAIEDEGPGLPADSEKLFEPFFTRRRGGIGLGLPIVQRVVAAHGGRVTAENRNEGGARFTVHLPVASPLLPKAVVHEKEER